MKPGKPLTFAEIRAKPTESMMRKTVLAFGLPGNPVSCLVCFNLYVVPTIRQLAGWTSPHPLRLVKFSLYLILHMNLSIMIISEGVDYRLISAQSASSTSGAYKV